MAKWLVVLIPALVSALQAAGQTDASPVLLNSLRQFREAVSNGQLGHASEIAGKLDEEVQQQYRKTLVADAPERVDEVLSWLPADTESFFFLQTPVRIDSPATFGAQPDFNYALDRLAKVGDGRFFKALHGTTVRLVASGMNNIKPRLAQITPPMFPAGDVVYFYFLDSSPDISGFGQPEVLESGHALWKAAASIAQPSGRYGGNMQEASWLALPRPGLLILSSVRELLTEVLTRMSSTGSKRALPQGLPEWKRIDRNYPFWALRHFAAASLQNPDDVDAVGAALEYDSASGATHMHYLTQSTSLPPFLQGLRSIDFRAKRVGNDSWLIDSLLKEHGGFPFHAGMGLLGYGLYR